MKFFVAHKVSGENWEELKVTIEKVCGFLKGVGHEYYCTFLNEINPDFARKFDGMSSGDILRDSLKMLDGCDGVLVFINSNDRSEGVLMEVGYALARNKKIVLAVKNGVDTYIGDGVADQVVEFENIDDLGRKLEVDI